MALFVARKQTDKYVQGEFMKILINLVAIFAKKFRPAIFKPILLLATLFTISQAAHAGGLMIAKDSNTQLQIKDHAVSVVIEDGYVITTVENEFYNPSNQDLEATYEFPVPKNGMVAEFSLWIDGQLIIGEVVEKERAKKFYQQEKAAGRDVGLTEKKSFYRFESHVSPVRAQQSTKTRLVYLQTADIQGGIGRYVYPLEEGGTDQDKLNFWKTDDQVHGQFSFNLNLRSGFPVDAVRAPAHSYAQITHSDKQNWSMSINKNGTNASTETIPENNSNPIQQQQGNRKQVFSDLEQQNDNINSQNRLVEDIVVYWRLAPNLPGSIELVAHKEPNQRRGTFMLTVNPGIDLQPITEGRDWVFVLDRSGSMQGKYQTLMDATAQTLNKLGHKDRFKIILFSNYVEELTKGWVNTDQISIEQASHALTQSQPDGGTNMYAGIEAAIKGLDSDRTSSIVLITDGVANLGKTEKSDFLDLVASKDIRLFTGIMGNGANRPLLDSLTHVSGGFSTSVSNSDDIMGVLLSATEKVNYQALHDVELKINGLKTTDIVPAQATTVYRGEQLVMFGHYFGEEQAEVVLKAKISGEEKEYRSTFNFPKEAIENPEIERLWAYAQIQSLQDKANYLGIDKGEYRKPIIDTAIEYGLVTDFTSMLVMNDAQFEKNNIQRKNLARRTQEQKASAQRKSKPMKSNRVDQQQPAFNSNRSNYSNSSGGGGSTGPFGLLVLLPLLIVFFRKRLIK